MKLTLQPGKYVAAVSGGVDSMVLLDLLSKQPGISLVVAHFDHGIREDSSLDKELVERQVANYGLYFESDEGKLGSAASEEKARIARYAFLERVKEKYKADAIITAHHQDDMIETAFINMLRGTGRKGLISLSSSDVVRPMLEYSKADIMVYAVEHTIEWREDSTNQNTDYLRNYIRKVIVPKLSGNQRAQMLSFIKNIKVNDEVTENEIANYLQLKDSNVLKKHLLTQLDHIEACEVMATWLRLNKIRDFDRKRLERLVIDAKTLGNGSKATINKGNYLEIRHTSLQISSV